MCVLVICVLVFTVFCIVCTVYRVLFRLCMFILICFVCTSARTIGRGKFRQKDNYNLAKMMLL